jgi:HPt (histidine-containing phosphotransfer) domain-containing protein
MNTNHSFEFNEALDGRFLNELFEDDPSYAIVVFKDFLKEMPQCFYDMQTAYDDSNFKVLKSAAHKCKTLFAYVGLSSLSTRLQALEMACSSPEEVDSVGPLVHEVIGQRQTIEILITEEIKRLEAFYEK